MVLSEIRLNHFKSFEKYTPIKLKEINILAGANSSGKSTIIQSILILKQTLQYGADSRPVTLNGPILRLGTLGDITSRNSKASSISISFCLEVSEAARAHPWITWLRPLRNQTLRGGGGLKDFEITLEIAVADEQYEDAPLRLSGFLKKIEIYYTIEDDDHKRNRLYFTAENIDDLPSSDNVHIDPNELTQLKKNFPDPRIKYAIFKKFLPSIFAIEYDMRQKKVEALTEYLVGNQSVFLSTHPDQDELIPVELSEIISLIIKTNQLYDTIFEKARTFREMKQAINHVLSPRSAGFLLSNALAWKNPELDLSQKEILRSELRNTIFPYLLKTMPPERETHYSYLDTLSVISEIVTAFFKDGIRYLGPLREAPRPVYQPEALESFSTVGYRGEHTATILEINKHQQVSFIWPPTDADSDSWIASSRVDRASLMEALGYWIRYLGLGSSVSTEDAGVYGNRLQVSIQDPNILHDLTNVGVGVSQVLPILVSTFLAPETSLLIFEQPELHLHPRVQSRIADFFICAAKLEKQLLIETHSEYLVDRLRLRIAQAKGTALSDLIKINFTQQSGEGVTSLTNIEVSEFGTIKNWPADFFDYGEKDSADILNAAKKKRKSLDDRN